MCGPPRALIQLLVPPSLLQCGAWAVRGLGPHGATMGSWGLRHGTALLRQGRSHLVSAPCSSWLWVPAACSRGLCLPREPCGLLCRAVTRKPEKTGEVDNTPPRCAASAFFRLASPAIRAGRITAPLHIEPACVVKRNCFQRGKRHAFVGAGCFNCISRATNIVFCEREITIDSAFSPLLVSPPSFFFFPPSLKRHVLSVCGNTCLGRLCESW